MTQRSMMVVAAGAALLAAVPAFAQTTVYKGFDSNTSTGRGAPSNPNSSAASAAFQATLSGTSTESFETYATRARPSTLTFTGSAGTLAATLSGSGSVGTAPRSNPTSTGQFATDGKNYYTVTSGDFSIAFGSGIAAFGFFATDIESDVKLIFTHATGPSETFSFASLFPGVGYDKATVRSGSVNFLGFIDTTNPFTGVTFGQGANSNGDILAFDQMTIGDARQVANPPAVPEPATWGMMILGFGAIGTALRRRQKVGVAYAA